MDSSGEYIKLRFPLLPKKRNERLTRQDWEQALLVQPMAKIPDTVPFRTIRQSRSQMAAAETAKVPWSRSQAALPNPKLRDRPVRYPISARAASRRRNMAGGHGQLQRLPKGRIREKCHASQRGPNSSKWYSILVPGCGPRGIPPRLHFGWVLDDDGNRLLDIAREKKIEPRDQREVKLLPKDDSDDEDIYEGPSVKMNELWLKQDALSAVGKELQLICEPYLDQVCCSGKRTVKIVGLIDNYSLKSQVVGRADIPMLVDYFNFDVGPLWFLDSYRWTWNID